MESGEEVTAASRLVDEFREFLDEPLILSIIGDYNIDDAAAFNEARSFLLQLKETASFQQEAEAEALSAAEGKLTVASDSFSTAQAEGSSPFDHVNEGRHEASKPSARSSSSRTTVSSEGASGNNAPLGVTQVTVFDDLSDSAKEQELLEIFKDLKPYDITSTLRKTNGDVDRAIEELLTLQFLRVSGEEPKGIDAFFVDSSDENSPSNGNVFKAGRSSASKRKKRRRDKRLAASLATDSMDGPSDPSAPAPSATRPQKLNISYTLRTYDGESVSALDVDRTGRATTSKAVTASSSTTNTATTPKQVATTPTANGGAWTRVNNTRAAARPILSNAATAQNGASSTPFAQSNHDKQQLAMERRNHLLATAASLSARSDPLLRQAAAVYGERAREETAALVAARSAEADAEIARQLARQQRKSPMENGGGTTTIDLHGFTLDDGVRIALRETAAWWDALADTAKSKRAASSFTIITGAGRHSADGRARMLSGCARALLQAGWRCEVGTGSVVVTGRAR